MSDWYEAEDLDVCVMCGDDLLPGNEEPMCSVCSVAWDEKAEEDLADLVATVELLEEEEDLCHSIG